MTPKFFQAATLKKVLVEATLKKFQVVPYKNLGGFYRVFFKSLPRVQIKQANDLIILDRQILRFTRFQLKIFTGVTPEKVKKDVLNRAYLA